MFTCIKQSTYYFVRNNCHFLSKLDETNFERIVLDELCVNSLFYPALIYETVKQNSCHL